ncbi:MAG TPA: metal-dependent transcriptional regulator [Bacteroidota bacterium]|nr:metal-dependent transcriptional regulator [Bacteroidota bacterium]
MASEQIENYLKNIYKIQSVEGKVSTSSLSERLQISPASVSEMVKKLADEGTLRHTPYKGVELTDRGKTRALKIIRKHRLWEMFLVEVLHFGWDEIDEEAEKFEHIMSDRMEDKIDEVLGFPSVDPHGDPIPTRNGTVKTIRAIPLADVEEGATVRVVRVNDANAELLQYASSIGVSLNKRIAVRQRMKFDNSLSVRIGSKDNTISAMLAANIFVEPA